MTPLRTRHPALALFWKIASISIGALLILLGIVMLFTPGPGWLAIFGGLAMLSPHSRLARALLTWLKEKLRIGRREPGDVERASDTGGTPNESPRDDRRARL